MTKMTSRQPREDFGLDDSSDLEDSWAAESVMFDASPVSSESGKFLQLKTAAITNLKIAKKC